MNTATDRVLRDAFAQIADEPAPVGLGPAALRLARRQRRRRTLLAVGAAVVLAAVATPIALHGADKKPTLPTGFQNSPLVVTAYSGTSTGTPKSLLLNKVTGAYAELPYLSAVPSPDGQRVLVRTGEDTPQSPLRSGILDPVTGEVRWIATYTGPGAWSPDGSAILFTERTRVDQRGFAIVSATTLKATFVPVNFAVGNSTGLDFVWGRDSGEVAQTLSDANGETQADMVTGIRFYTIAGELARTLPATAELRSADAFSPDRSRIALHDLGGGAMQIVSADTGAVERTIAVQGHTELVGWADDDHLLTRHWAADRTESEIRVIDLTGRTTAVAPLIAAGSTADGISIGSAAGLSETAAGLSFSVAG
ncbi:MAG: hypothetical protein HOV77_21910 [Hamadaea sp.]|uniref:hypothetical protein n=1 Tax=Hamadaea sp. TaxID=2024425 RepID=UPI0017EB5BA9|nr:hypothetical protein [Hamadaea sp.]NUT21839.1 hypothetical protein [Hamadaea sp.]